MINLCCFHTSSAHIKVMEQQKQNPSAETSEKPQIPANNSTSAPPSMPVEKGGRKGPEPTRYGDWELNGKCVDF